MKDKAKEDDLTEREEIDFRGTAIYNSLIGQDIQVDDSANHHNAEFSGPFYFDEKHQKTFWREDDDEDEPMQRSLRLSNLPDYYIEKQKYEVELSVRHLFQFCMYYLLFVYLLGPFIVLPFLLSKKRSQYWNLFYNMKFITLTNLEFWTQIVWWMCNLSIVGGFFIGKFSNKTLVSYITIYTLITNGLLRVVSMAATYSTLPENTLRLMKTEKLNMNDIESEDMLSSWTKQEDFTIKENINASVYASCLDTSVFWINFMSSPSFKIEAQLLSIKFEEDKEDPFVDQSRTVKFKSCRKLVKCTVMPREVKYYNGIHIFYHLVLKTKKKMKGVWLPAFGLAIVKSFIPLVFAAMIKSGRPELDRQEMMIAGFVHLFLLYLNTYNIAYFLLAIFDLGRKSLIQDQLTNINAVHKKHDKRRLLPMINFLDFTTLSNWKGLLDLNRNYGKKFFLRHQIFLAFVFLMTITSYLVLYVNLTSTENIDKASFEKVAFWMFIYFDLIFFYSMFIALMFSASKFNGFYSTNLARLRSKIHILEQIRLFQSHYLENQQHKNLIPNELSDSLFTDSISNSLLRAISREVKKQVIPSSMDYHLKELIKYHRTLIENLSKEQESESVRVFGISVTKQFIQSFVVFFMPFIIKLHHEFLSGYYGYSPFSV